MEIHWEEGARDREVVGCASRTATIAPAYRGQVNGQMIQSDHALVSGSVPGLGSILYPDADIMHS